MAQGTPVSFGDFKVYIGDGASPEVFAQPCGFTQKSLTLTKAMSEAILPDCSDPTLVPWTIAGPTSKGATVNGDGVMAQEAYLAWVAAWESDDPTNVRVQVANLGYWHGPAEIETLGHAVQYGSDASMVKLTVALRNASAWVWTAGPPA